MRATAGYFARSIRASTESLKRSVTRSVRCSNSRLCWANCCSKSSTRVRLLECLQDHAIDSCLRLIVGFRDSKNYIFQRRCELIHIRHALSVILMSHVGMRLYTSNVGSNCLEEKGHG